ncbi:PilW family protein [Marinobacter halodurans]|nr:prepilin-type N-terminal cleavage/methylation domain-containing protein [Marinobacter halodurans]
MSIRPPTQQQGFSLVELMVTLVISLVAIISILSLFQGMTRNSVEVKVGASLDGDVQLGLLTAHKLLQGAGFSSAADAATPGYGTDLLLISKARLDKSGAFHGTPVASKSLGTPVKAGAGWALLWRSGDTLEGLYAPAKGGLLTLTATGGATPLTGSSNNWQTNTALIAPPSVDSANLASTGRVGVTLASSSCQPPGLAAESVNTGKFTVTLAANGYAAGAAQVSTTCLVNF